MQFHPLRACCVGSLLWCVASVQSNRVCAQDAAGLEDDAGRWPVTLFSELDDASDRASRPTSVDLGEWTYRVTKVAPRDGVLWELSVTPTKSLGEGWQKARGGSAPTIRPLRNRGDLPVLRGGKPSSWIPAVEVPPVLWQQWMAADLQDVVGIHFHEVVTDDLARILFTIHKVPADNPARSKPASAEKAEPTGTRIEATLLTPLKYSFDQSIVVREDKIHPDRTQRRADHERGHAEVSQEVFFAVLAGPQNWDPKTTTGRRSRIEYFWKQEQIGRAWDGCRDGSGKIRTVRTSAILVPPTRWSLLLPIPPERVTQKHVQDFNDAIVGVAERFEAVDAAAQKQFHSQHGTYEAADP